MLSIPRTRSKDPAVQALQDNVETALRDVTSRAILDGLLIEDVELTTTPTKVAHGLGREPIGWIVVRKNAQEDVWENESATPKRTLVLDASGTVTISLWVF